MVNLSDGVTGVLIDGVDVLAPASNIQVGEECEECDVTTMFEPDPNWQHTDSAGHYHARATDRPFYPTLVERKRLHEAYEYDGDGDDCRMDEWYEPYLVCALCEEEIKPGVRPGERRSMPGRRRVDLMIAFPPGLTPSIIEQRKRCSVAVLFGQRVKLFGIAEATISRLGPHGCEMQFLFHAAGTR
jgi:hypothetical protein